MKETTIFTREILEDNELAFKNLIEFIKSGDAILMAGAGCSGALFPPWGAFVDMLETAALEIDSNFTGDKKSFLIFADKVKECLSADRYYSLIYDTFKPGDPTHLPFHVTLCSLPFKAITTTNYDMVLEHALTVVTGKPNNSLHFEGTTKNKINEFLRSLNFNKSSRKLVVHLHGIYEISDSIVLGGREYSSKYGFELGNNEDTLFDQLKIGDLSKERLNDLLIKYGYEWPLRRKLLWSLLATRRIVFIGFSMSDPYFIKMLEFVKNDISTYNGDSHFLILRVTTSSLKRNMDQASYLKREYGIQTVFYVDDEGKYNGIEQFVADLENQVNFVTKETFVTQTNFKEEETIESQGDETLTNELFSLSKTQYSNED